MLAVLRRLRFSGRSTVGFVRGVITGACLAFTVGTIYLSQHPVHNLDFALLRIDGEKTGLSKESADRINRATELFMEAFVLVERQHAEMKLEEDVASRMLDAALEEIDPYSGFLDQRTAESLTSPNGEHDRPRLGVMIMDIDEKYVIEAVMPDSPAEVSGLKPGDRVVRVGDRYVGDEMPRKVNETIREEIERAGGGLIRLGVLRPGHPREMAITIVPEPVRTVGAYDLGRKDDVLHIHLERFYHGAAQDVADILRRQMRNAPLEGVIIDLRDNGGGLTSEARQLGGLFLERGSLLYEMSGRAIGVETVRTDREPEFRDLNLSVIVNKNSASASEIFAGAIQAHDRGKIVGWTSHGKGTVQRVFPVREGAIKVTVAEYRDGGLREINGIGVHPDIPIPIPDPGHRPSRFSPDEARDRARIAAGELAYVASQ